MRERKDLENFYRQAFSSGKNLVLATLIDTQGSTYRIKGARLLFSEDGASCGLLSGGCLEPEIKRAGFQTLVDRTYKIVRFNTEDSQDSLFGFGLGCRGSLDILLEPLFNADQNSLMLLKALAGRYHSERLIHTVIELAAPKVSNGNTFCARIIETDNQDAFVIGDAFFASLSELQRPASSYKIFSERLYPDPSIHIFGAGVDAIPVAEMALILGWDIQIWYHRPYWIENHCFPQNCRVSLLNSDAISIDQENAIFVVMTHNLGIDTKILKALLPIKYSYLGLLGPKHRRESIFKELLADGLNVNLLDLSRFYSPIGLSTGGRDPYSIALSIVAEIQAVINRGTGNHRRDFL